MTQWGSKSMESLHKQAKTEPTGNAFESIRVAGGKRLMVVMCVTKKDQIALLKKAFNFVDGGAPEDWATLTLLEVAMRSVAGAGFAFEALKDSSGEISDLIFISTEPRSMAIIDGVFTMPK